MIFKEGIFRKPRLRTNKILKRFSYLFEGDVINVSASSDSDKNCGIIDYYFGDYDNGQRYKDYFFNAKNYTISNYLKDKTQYQINENMIYIDLEEDLPKELEGKFDVVYNHTVFEHIFDIFKAFKNLCKLSSDVVIFIVPQFQRIHDYNRGYEDYWRFTPFSVDKMFKSNGFQVLYRETTFGFSESMYLFYIASRKPDKWIGKFPKIKNLKDYITKKNDGINYFLYSRLIINIDFLIRKIGKIFKK